MHDSIVNRKKGLCGFNAFTSVYFAKWFQLLLSLLRLQA